MPSNYSPYGSTPEEKQKELFANVDSRVDTIVKTVEKREYVIESSNTSFFKTHIFPGLLYRLGYPQIKILDNNFTVDDTCNGD